MNETSRVGAMYSHFEPLMNGMVGESVASCSDRASPLNNNNNVKISQDLEDKFLARSIGAKPLCSEYKFMTVKKHPRAFATISDLKESTDDARHSSNQLAMSQYLPGVHLYKPPSNEMINALSGYRIETCNVQKTVNDIENMDENNGIVDLNNNNDKTKKLEEGPKDFFQRYNLKMKNSSHELSVKKSAENFHINNNSIPPGGSILTMAKNMVKKANPVNTPEKVPDIYSFFKHTGSNVFYSYSSQELLEDSQSIGNYEENAYEEANPSEFTVDDLESRTKMSDKTSCSKKVMAHVERVPIGNEKQLGTGNKKTRIYMNTNLPIKRVYNANNASSYLKDKYHNRYLKCSESTEGYDQTVHKVMKSLYDCWLDQSQCDVAIVTDDGEIMCHQALLSSFSSTLSRQFKSNKAFHDNDNAEGTQQLAVIDMSKFPKEIITDILHFLYTTDIRITDSNVTKLLMVAKKLDLDVVTAKCREYLSKDEPEMDLLLHYMIANNCELNDVKASLQAKIAEYFDNICFKHNLKKLSRSLLVGILNHPNFKANEENKLMAISKWIEHNKTDRIKNVQELMAYVNFEQIQIDKLTKLVENIEWMFTASCMRNKLLDAYKFHSVKGVFQDKSGQDVSIPASEHMVGTTDNNNAYNSETKSEKDVHVTDNFEVLQDSTKIRGTDKLSDHRALEEKSSKEESTQSVEKKFINKSFNTDPIITKRFENKIEKPSETIKTQPVDDFKRRSVRPDQIEYQLSGKNTPPPHEKNPDYKLLNCKDSQCSEAPREHRSSQNQTDNQDIENCAPNTQRYNLSAYKPQDRKTPDLGERPRSVKSVSEKSWPGVSQGIISVFEARFKPPAVKQYQLQNNLASEKYIEL